MHAQIPLVMGPSAHTVSSHRLLMCQEVYAFGEKLAPAAARLRIGRWQWESQNLGLRQKQLGGQIKTCKLLFNTACTTIY